MTGPELERHFHTQIPITAAMGLQVRHLRPGSIRLVAPLEANVNDKMTAFGGSLASLLTLAGWGLLHVELGRRELDADVVIQKSEFLYYHPVRGELTAYCDLPGEQEWERFITLLKRKRRSRVIVTSWIAGPESAAVTMEGRYAAFLRDPGESA
ncbi:MAG: YiiD C-terminal domain-containing protein [Xanthomonadales bacterium]|nr:YiiD C-terminal domain-containing protein [Xanthomonadales bacterium]